VVLRVIPVKEGEDEKDYGEDDEKDSKSGSHLFKIVKIFLFGSKR